jgi:hypothetical protein
MHDSQFSVGQGAKDQCLLFQFLVDFGSSSWFGIWVNETSLKSFIQVPVLHFLTLKFNSKKSLTGVIHVVSLKGSNQALH